MKQDIQQLVSKYCEATLIHRDQDWLVHELHKLFLERENEQEGVSRIKELELELYNLTEDCKLVRAIACGEEQVADNDTDGMAYIYDLLKDPCEKPKQQPVSDGGLLDALLKECDNVDFAHHTYMDNEPARSMATVINVIRAAIWKAKKKSKQPPVPESGMKKVDLDYLVHPPDLDECSTTEGKLFLRILDKDSPLYDGYLGDSGQRLASAGARWWFKKHIAINLLQAGVAELVKQDNPGN